LPVAGPPSFKADLVEAEGIPMLDDEELSMRLNLEVFGHHIAPEVAPGNSKRYQKLLLRRPC